MLMQLVSLLGPNTKKEFAMIVCENIVDHNTQLNDHDKVALTSLKKCKRIMLTISADCHTLRHSVVADPSR